MSFHNFLEKLDNQSQKLINDGYFIFEIEDIDYLNLLRDELLDYLRHIVPSITNLQDMHQFIKIKELNDVRIGFYNQINTQVKKEIPKESLKENSNEIENDLIKKLKDLKKLYDDGWLSEEEFAKAKKKILN